ncbi:MULTISPECIES: hypothetical protein [unclassified Paenibacillus]|uniref:hypothetical protein n=1 Tax=unclassified Paenibacillus TaxID=185978 RepID=UPI000FE1C2DA|nr:MULTISPECIES: hypothetical protein [unclassified Paenibacillus]MCM3172868.1 hypothetical protein [Paenibacillus sp. MER 99-2]
MEFSLGSVTIVLPPLLISMIMVIIIFLLVRWSRQLETRRFTIFFYFWISTFTTPIYSHATTEGFFQLSLPMGFLLILLYLSGGNSRYHPSKMKASLLGLSVALYQLILQYFG